MDSHPFLIVFGEILWDILPDGDHLGGAPLNLAYRVRGLGDTPGLVSRLGTDAYGLRARDRIRDMKLHDELIQTDDLHATGTVPVQFDDTGEPRYEILDDVAYDYIETSDATFRSVQLAQALCYGTVALRSKVSRHTLERLCQSAPDTLRFCDINLRPACYTESSVRSALNHATVVKVNEAEIKEISSLFGDPQDTIPIMCQRLVQKWNLEALFVTLGDKGSLAVERNGTIVYDPGYAINFVDPIGSGDAFSAAAVHALLDGQSLKKACQQGNILGACVASQPGASEPVTKAMRETIARSHGRVKDNRFRSYQDEH